MNEAVAVGIKTEEEAYAWISAALVEGDLAKKAETLRLAAQFKWPQEPIVAQWEAIEAEQARKRRLAELVAKAKEAGQSQGAAQSQEAQPLSEKARNGWKAKGGAIAERLEEARKALEEEPKSQSRKSQSEAREPFFDAAAQPRDEKAETATEPSPRIQLPAVVPPTPVVALDEAIAAMNKRHAVIDNYGGKTVIACWDVSPLNPSLLKVEFHNKESFLLRYSNRSIPIETPDGRGGFRSAPMLLGQWWLNHRDRQQYRGVTFLPGGPPIDRGCLNLWQGWGVEAKPGDWGLIRQHIVEVIASGNVVFADYVIWWIAWAIQNPDKQAEVALVLIGEKGAGKGSLVRCLERIFGAHAFQISSQEEVIGKYNDHLKDCVLFIADEAYWGGDKRCVGRLQGMITEPMLTVHPKGMNLYKVQNRLHMMMLAEPGWVIPAGRYERRYAAIEVSKARLRDKGYFDALHRQIKEGGAEAMLWELGRLDLGDWHPRQIPEELLKGAALQRQQRLTLPPLWQWMMLILHDGTLPGLVPKRPNTAWTSGLIADAKEREPRLRYNLTEAGLRNFLIDEIGCTKYRHASANGWAFPPLAEVRSNFEERYGGMKWDTEREEWKAGLGVLRREGE